MGTATATSSDVPIATPWLEENYQSYTSTANWQSNSKNGTFYGSPASAQLDTTSCRVAVITMNPAEMSTVCGKYYVGYDLNFPAKTGQAFVEIWVKFDTNFTVQPPQSATTDASCAWLKASVSQSGFTMLLGRLAENAGAFGVTLGTGWPFRNSADVGSPCYGNAALVAAGGFVDWGNMLPGGATWSKQLDEDYKYMCSYYYLKGRYDFAAMGAGQQGAFAAKMMRFDGLWHQYRFWLKDAGGVHPNQGGVSVWVDGVPLGTLQNQDTDSDYIIGLSIARFMSNRPGSLQHVQFGRIRVWNTNPGWNLCQLFCY